MHVEPPRDLLDGRYEVGAVIGVGGMAEVRAGFDRKLGRDVALKFLRPDLAQQDDVRRRFEEEARSAARIIHAAAVTVFDSGESDGVAYLVTERLPGRTMADRLLEGPLAEREVVDVAIDVLAALGAAHRLGIVHRDVKPGNLLYTEEDRVKLADFGIAKSAEGLDHTVTGQVIGTPAYLAPERLRGQAATPATDLYSLGVVMYEALTGRKPFQGDTPLALAYAIDTTEPDPLEVVLPTIDRNLAITITRALAKDPATRHSTAGEMADSLQKWRGAPADPPTESATARTEVQRAEPTAVMPHAATASRADPGPERTRPAPVPVRRRAGTPTWPYLAAAAIVVVLLLAVLADLGGGGDPDAPPTSSTTAATTANPPPPDPLDRAIRELEQAIEP